MSGESVYNQVLSQHRQTLDRIIERGSVDRLRRVYDRATNELLRKLENVGGRGTFTDMQQRRMLAQLMAGQIHMSDEMTDTLASSTREAQVDSLHSLVRGYKKLEKHFTGLTPTLPIEEMARFSGVIDKRRASLLQQHRSSMRNYGKALVTDIREELAVSLGMGENFDATIKRVQKTMGGEWYQAERIARTECLLPDTLVCAGMVRAVFRRAYEGPVLEIVTERGRRLSATPNHPVLTNRGWIGAHALQRGDYLICDPWKQDASSAGDEHVEAAPSKISQVFDSLAAVGVRERRRTGKPDFHGDGMDGDVDVAIPSGLLKLGAFSALAKPVIENLLSPADLAGLTFRHRDGHLLTVPKQVGFSVGSDGHASFLQTTDDGLVIDSVLAPQSKSALPSLIARDQLGDVDVGSIIARPSATFVEECFPRRRSSLNSSGADDLVDPVGGEPRGSVDIGDAHPRSVEIDRVVDVRVRAFRGHVFNLSTADGYYVANGVYTMNCAWAASMAHVDGIVEVAKDDPEIMQQWIEFCGPDGRPLDDRVGVDSIAMHGQVTRPGGVFTMPATAPYPDAKGNTKVSDSLVGKSWAAPPCRPNGRETVAPWRRDWGTPGWEYRDGRRHWLVRG